MLILIPVKTAIMFSDEQSSSAINRITRKTSHGFNLIPSQVVEDHLHKDSNSRDVCVCYTLPIDGAPQLFVT